MMFLKRDFNDELKQMQIYAFSPKHLWSIKPMLRSIVEGTSQSDDFY